MRTPYRCSRVVAAVLLLALSGCRSQDTASHESRATTLAHTDDVHRVADPAIGLTSASTYAVIIGVLNWQSPTLAGFSDRNRKDRELYEVLLERGVPAENMELLLDEQATRTRMWEALERTVTRAQSGSTLLFYYAGHGVRGGDGTIYFANYDMGPRAERSGFSIDALGDLLKRAFRGERVVLMADCCYSGGLTRVAHALEQAGIPASVLTSAEASNLSTANWTFTQTIIDGLRGDRLCDRDSDGTITLHELSREVADAMKYRERQRHGYAPGSVATHWPLSRARTRGPQFQPETNDIYIGKYVSAKTKRGWEPARVRRIEGDNVHVQLYRYSDKKDIRSSRQQLQSLSFRRYPVGSDILVYWGGKLWDAHVTSVDGDFHRITYPGWPSYWDEWVMSDRIADTNSAETLDFREGDAIQVEWRGAWYPALVVKIRGNRALIHYDEHDDSWDEWVTRHRMRPR